VAPATATIARVKVISVAGTSYANWSIGSFLELDGLIVVQGENVPSYFDGSTAAALDLTYAWTGTAHASTSTRSGLLPTGLYVRPASTSGTWAQWQRSTSPLYGTYSARYECQIAPTVDAIVSFGQDSVLAGARSAVVAGLEYAATIAVRPSKAQRMHASIRWLDNTGTQLSATDAADQVVPLGVWTTLSVVGVAPVGAVAAVVRVASAASGTGYVRWAAPDTIDVDGAMITFGDTVLPYFDGSTIDTDAYDYSWLGTAFASVSQRSYHVDAVDPLVDPDIPAIPDPPAPPSITNVAITPQNEWRRYYGEIPAANVALWANTVPTVELSTADVAAGQVRVRYYPNPFGWAHHDVDPTSYCAEFLLSYLPPNTVLTVIGASERAIAAVAGAEAVMANQLLYGTAGAPVSWPALSCGIPYLVTVDVPPSFDIEQLSVDLFVNLQE